MLVPDTCLGDFVQFKNTCVALLRDDLYAGVKWAGITHHFGLATKIFAIPEVAGRYRLWPGRLEADTETRVANVFEVLKTSIFVESAYVPELYDFAGFPRGPITATIPMVPGYI